MFTGPRHPLVLFLDDLQWADAASLNLLHLLMTASDNHNLLIIGAYRDNEMREAHPLQLYVGRDLQRQKYRFAYRHRPLGLLDVQQLIADTLKCTPERAKSLAELVLAKTDGNPFFINEFLKSLHTEGLLTFDAKHREWQWDVQHIKVQDITDNVVELMASRMQRLGGRTQEALKFAACIGNQFDLRTLTIVCEKSPSKVAADLVAAMMEGLIVPLSDAHMLINPEAQGLDNEVMAEYKFAHDRIQQAAYSLIPQAEKQAVHRRVGHGSYKICPQRTVSKIYLTLLTT